MSDRELDGLWSEWCVCKVGLRSSRTSGMGAVRSGGRWCGCDGVISSLDMTGATRRSGTCEWRRSEEDKLNLRMMNICAA